MNRINEGLVFYDVDVDERMDVLDEDTKSMLKKSRARAAPEFCADMLKIVNNPDYSDVVFLCKDGARVHASRLFLVARSTVLHCMLLNGMAESELSEITLHEVSSTALLPVMEFLYTGTLQEYIPKDWQKAFEIIGAAKFLLLKELEFIVVDYFLLAAAKARRDIQATETFLSIAVEFSDIHSETVELIASDLVCTLEWHYTSLTLDYLSEYFQGLTANAFLYFLEKTKSKNVEPKFVSEAEFSRFRIIVVWCACKEFSPKEPEILCADQPDIMSVLEFFGKRLEQLHPKPCSHSETFQKIKPALALSVKQFLPLVDLRRIQPWFLAHCIEPMDIIPSSTILEAFRFHALRHQFTEMGDRGWRTIYKDLAMYMMDRDRSCIRRQAPGIGFAMYTFEIDSKCWKGDFEWEITIEEVCEGFIEIGLLHYDDYGLVCRVGQSLSGQPGGWALRMDSGGLFINRTAKHESSYADLTLVSLTGVKDYSDLVYGKDFAHKNSKIKVCFHMAGNRCSFRMDNENLGTVWSHIPRGKLFPAVSLGTGSKGRIRIRILED